MLKRLVVFVVLLIVDSMDAAFRYWEATTTRLPTKLQPKRWHKYFDDPV